MDSSIPQQGQGKAEALCKAARNDGRNYTVSSSATGYLWSCHRSTLSATATPTATEATVVAGVGEQQVVEPVVIVGSDATDTPTATVAPLSSDDTDTPTPSVTPIPATDTPTPSNTPVPPTATPTPSMTPVPATDTPTPSNTPVPPTATPTATDTPVPANAKDVGNVQLTSSQAGVLEVTWNAPAATPKDYRVSWAKVGDKFRTWTDLSGNAFPTSPSYTISGLEGGVRYKVRLRARYHEGRAGDWSAVYEADVAAG